MVSQFSGYGLCDRPKPGPPLHCIVRCSFLFLHAIGLALLLYVLGWQGLPPERQTNVQGAL